MCRSPGWGGVCSGALCGAEGGAYHGHLLLEVVHVPALLGLALLGRALVIFLVLRGGDTIAVRATRLRARRDYRGTPALRAHSPRPASLRGFPCGPGCLPTRRVSSLLTGLAASVCLWVRVPDGLHLGQPVLLSLCLCPHVWAASLLPPGVFLLCVFPSASFFLPLDLTSRAMFLAMSVCLSLVCLGLCLRLSVLFCFVLPCLLLSLYRSIFVSLWLFLSLIALPHQLMSSVLLCLCSCLCMNFVPVGSLPLSHTTSVSISGTTSAESG